MRPNPGILSVECSHNTRMIARVSESRARALLSFWENHHSIDIQDMPGKSLDLLHLRNSKEGVNLWTTCVSSIIATY